MVDKSVKELLEAVKEMQAQYKLFVSDRDAIAVYINNRVTDAIKNLDRRD